MKKLLSFLLLLMLLLVGVYVAVKKQLITVSDQSPFAPVTKYVEDLKIAELDQLVDQLEKLITGETKEDPASAYCHQRGGVIEVHQRDEGPTEVCFINDGKDGIRCQLQLYFTRQCGHGEPDDTSEVTILDNDNDSSEIAAIITAENGEGAVVIRKVGSTTIDRLYLFSANGRQAIITPNAQGLAAKYEEEGLTVTYENYTGSTVDITVTTADGSKTELKDYPFSSSQVSSTWLIPPAHALFGDFRVNVSLLLNSVSCAAGIFGSPTAIISCPVLVARLGSVAVSQVVDIPGCAGEEIGECAIRHFNEYRAQKKLRGTVTSKADGKAIAAATIVLSRSTGEVIRIVKTDASGNFTINISGGISLYTLKARAPEHPERLFNVIESSDRLRVSEGSDTLLEQTLSGKFLYSSRMSIVLTPDDMIEEEEEEEEEDDEEDEKEEEKEDDEDIEKKDEQEDDEDSKEDKKEDEEKPEEKKEDETETETPTPPSTSGTPPEETKTTYTVPLDFNFSESGITNSGTGTLTIFLDGKKSSCNFSLEGSASGVPDVSGFDVPAGVQIPAISGTYSGHSDNCSGEHTQYDDIYLSGDSPANVDFSAGGRAQSLDVSAPFRIEGKVSNGSISGFLIINDTIKIPFPSQAAPAAGKYDGNWTAVSVDTSANDGCTGFAFDFSVENSQLGGFFSGSVDTDGRFSTAVRDKNGERVLYTGELGNTHGEGTYQSDPFKSNCSGTFTTKKL